jgi:hypothetical protein
MHVEGSEWSKMGLGVIEQSSVVKRWHVCQMLEATGDIRLCEKSPLKCSGTNLCQPVTKT